MNLSLKPVFLVFMFLFFHSCTTDGTSDTAMDMEEVSDEGGNGDEGVDEEGNGEEDNEGVGNGEGEGNDEGTGEDGNNGDDGDGEGQQGTQRMLLFSKTSGFRHGSIGKGLETMEALGLTVNVESTATEDAQIFNASDLSEFDLVVFLNTTGNILNDEQQEAFESFIQSGGSFMGVHSATDTEYDWAWYGDLVGAYFDGHPNRQDAVIEVLTTAHPATMGLGATWNRFDEWYNFRDINPSINPLLNLDEDSYQGGTNGENHPISWYHEFDGGRSFYTGMGHTEASYDEPQFQEHLLGGILWCLDKNP